MFGFSTRTIIQNKHQNKHKNGTLQHKTILPLLFLSSDLKPIENECGELKRRRSTNMEQWIWRIWRDSVWRKWSPISCQVFSKLFRHYIQTLMLRTAPGSGHPNNIYIRILIVILICIHRFLLTDWFGMTALYSYLEVLAWCVSHKWSAERKDQRENILKPVKDAETSLAHLNKSLSLRQTKDHL